MTLLAIQSSSGGIDACVAARGEPQYREVYMGYGEYTGNMSVHWAIVHHNGTSRPGAIRGRDPIAFQDIGVDAARELTPGTFRVRLRFGSFAEATAALVAASVGEEDGNFYLHFDVPVVNRAEDKVEPADPPSEVRVDW